MMMGMPETARMTTLSTRPGARLYPLTESGTVAWHRPMVDVEGSEDVPVVGGLGVAGVWSSEDPRTPWRIVRFHDGEEYAVQTDQIEARSCS
jgi:hypothetical protein